MLTSLLYSVHICKNHHVVHLKYKPFYLSNISHKAGMVVKEYIFGTKYFKIATINCILTALALKQSRVDFQKKFNIDKKTEASSVA
jgi:hypothetical protein